LCDGIWANSSMQKDNEGFRGLYFREMVSPDAPDGAWERKFDDVGMECSDFSSWPGQDLLILMEKVNGGYTRRMHFRTLSTNETHPRSKAPFVDLDSGDCEIWEGCQTISFQDRLALKFVETVDEVEKSAGLILDCTEAKVVMPYMPLLDLAFLTKDDILVLLKEEDTGTLALGLFSVPEKKIVIRCRLPFPDPAQNAFILNGPTALYGDDCQASRAKMLQPELKHRIVSIVYNHELRPYSFCVILQTGPFLRVCEQLRQDDPDTDSFEWVEWGPDVTRCIPLLVALPTGYRCTFGSYMLILGRPKNWIEDFTDDRAFLMLLDFNPVPIRRGVTEHTEEDYYVRLVQEELGWYTSPNHISEHVISTSLPYRVFMKPWKSACSNLHIDASTIVARLPEKYCFFSFLPPEEGQKDTSASDFAELLPPI
ncbi:hypothetical protein CPB86DRAFT_694419, partial [Serendipita vermifera]